MIKALSIILFSLLEIVPAGKTYIKPLQERDSVLIADQFEYGVVLEKVDKSTSIALPDLKGVFNDTLVLVRNWQLDTLYSGKKISSKKFAKLNGKPYSLRASLIVSPFEEGEYQLPQIPVLRQDGSGAPDTLLFEAQSLDVKTIPVDTASFQTHELKPQITYPITFKEVMPKVAIALGVIFLIAALVWLLSRRKKKVSELIHKDPPHIVALRELDKYRSEKLWAPEKQKYFYSGITDALKTYIDARFGVDAPEMTTAELFAALKGEKDLTPELYAETKALFELADFVKFAKFHASEEDSAKALPVAVRFVTTTYQAEITEENK